jgi:putative inorganic carbon (HCO3(-)) transporter
MIHRANSALSIQAFPFSLRSRGMESLAAALGLSAVPLSIAVSESFLAIALALHAARMIRDRTPPDLPRICWLWLIWAALEIFSWIHSSKMKAGAGEMRHLLLIAAIFVILPAIDRPLTIWRGLFLTSSIGSIALVVGTVTRMIHYRLAISLAPDPSFYIRNGGFLHHWMIYATVEILIFGALLEFRVFYPEERRWSTAALAIHCLGILFSLTRTLWIGCFLIAALHLLWRRSKWIFALPALPILVFLLAPAAVRSRVIDSSHPDYYSNAERIQMWRVGIKMIREHPVFGIGPGRVENQYTTYLPPHDPVPAYHGHLHNNALQLAAQFGLPVLAAAVVWLAMLLKDLTQASRRPRNRERSFLCRAAFLGIAGFLIVGMTDYTYGHALGLILFSFVAIFPLTNVARFSTTSHFHAHRAEQTASTL